MKDLVWGCAVVKGLLYFEATLAIDKVGRDPINYEFFNLKELI